MRAIACTEPSDARSGRYPARLTTRSQAPESFPRPLTLCAWAFPFLLWFLATFYFLGDLGWWNDDYFFCMADPATGQHASLILTARDPYLPATGHLNPWRPLHFIFTPSLVTLTWNAPWIAHLFGAAVHGLCSTLLFRLMRSLGASFHAAAACALLFMVHPLHYEVTLWPSAFATGLSNALFLFTTLIVVRSARTLRSTHMWALPVLTAVMVCLNEQAAVCIGALPLAYLAACPADEPWPRRLLRAMVPSALGTAIVVAYVLNVRYNGQAGLGTNPDSYVPLAALPARLVEMFRGMSSLLMLENFAAGATLQGLVEFFGNAGRAVIVVGATGCAALAALWIWFNTPVTRRTAPSSTTPRGGRAPIVLAFAVAWLVLACLPQAAITGYVANSRTFYLVAAAVFLGLSVLGDWIATLFHRFPVLAGPYRVVSGVVLVTLMLWGGFMMVGVQGRQHRVHHEGLEQALQLKALVPDPEPGTYFLPVAHYAPPVSTGHWFFDGTWGDAWCSSWSSPTFLKRIYRRNDIYQGFYNTFHDGYSLRTAITGISVDDVTMVWKGDAPYGTGPGLEARVPLAKVVPFVIDPRGRVRILTSWFVQPQDGGLAFTVDMPQTRSMMQRNELPPFIFAWPAADWSESAISK